MKLTIPLSTFLHAEKASVRLCNMFRYPNAHPIGDHTLSQFINQWPLERLRKEVFGFGSKAQAELLEILSRHNSCKTGRRFADYCASLRPVSVKKKSIIIGNFMLTKPGVAPGNVWLQIRGGEGMDVAETKLGRHLEKFFAAEF